MRLFWLLIILLTKSVSGIEFADVKEAIGAFDKVIDAPFVQKLGQLSQVSNLAIQFSSKLTPFGTIIAEVLRQAVDVSFNKRFSTV